ncbi:MAG: adenylate/guanylate cyclase domain-containing protein [Eubacteriales bacterium]|nr:adenylate/guanylate cyclase domain-containing protein [Eubacteriales bacterium]
MRKKLLPVIIAFLWALVGAFCVLGGWLGTAEAAMQDAVFQRSFAPRRDIHVIGIDEATIDELGAFASWSRQGIADVIRMLNADPENKPAVIAVDVMFAGETDAAADAALADACREGGNVIVAKQVVYAREVAQQNGVYRIDPSSVSTILRPYDALAAVTEQGFINSALDTDGVARNVLYQMTFDGQHLYGLSSAAATAYGSISGNALHTPPASENELFPLRYTAKPGAYYGGNSFARVLKGDIPAARFAGDLVFIGPYAAGMMDAYPTPMDRATPMNGVEIHANVADALLSGRFFNDIPIGLQVLVIGLLLFAITWLFQRWSGIRSAILLVAAMALFTGLLLLGRTYGVRFHVLTLPIGALTAYIVSVAAGFLRESRKRLAVMRAFKQYVSPNVVDRILAEGAEDSMSNRRREIAVMFLDIRSFTSLSEKLSPEEIVDILNQYLSLITRVVFDHGGTIDKFIGDGCMVLFNAPVEQPDYEFLAVKTALAIVEEARELSHTLERICGREVMVGIGINAGPAVVGNIGTSYRMDYTAIGDTVNTAARLESKAAPGAVVVGEALYKKLEARVEAEYLGELALKGKAQSLPCYNITSLREQEGTPYEEV